MRISKALLFSVLFTMASLNLLAAGEPVTDTTLLPENALIISISAGPSGIFYTMIDSDNNEMVIVYYGTDVDFPRISRFELRKVIRTGIKLDPANQMLLLNSYQSKEKIEPTVIVTQ